MKTYICKFSFNNGNGYAVINAERTAHLLNILKNQSVWPDALILDFLEVVPICTEDLGLSIITSGAVISALTPYEVAVLNGFKGTLEEWLESLKIKGDPFRYEDFTEEQLEALKGELGNRGVAGESAYELAVRLGYEGSASDWINSFALFGESAITTVNNLFGFNYTFSFINATYTDNSFDVTNKKIDTLLQLKDCPILYLGTTNTAATYPQEGILNANGYRPMRDTVLRITDCYPDTIIQFETIGIDGESLILGSTNVEYVNQTSYQAGNSTIYTVTLKILLKQDATLVLKNLNYKYYRNIRVYSNNAVFAYKSELEALKERVSALELNSIKTLQ